MLSTLLCAALLCVLLAQAVSADKQPTLESTLTVNDGTDFSYMVPVYGTYCNTYQQTQYIIPEDDLTCMEGFQITSLTYYVCNEAFGSWNAEFAVYLETTDKAFIDPASGLSLNHAVKVFEGELSAADSTMVIPLSVPYSYTGGNLTVDADYCGIEMLSSPADVLIGGTASADITAGRTGIDLMRGDLLIAEAADVTVSAGGVGIQTTDGDVILTDYGSLSAESSSDSAVVLGSADNAVLLNGSGTPVSFTAGDGKAAVRNSESDTDPVGGTGLSSYTAAGNFSDSSLSFIQEPEHGETDTYFNIIIRKSVNGSVAADRVLAKEGRKVTLTVSPDKGFTLETLTVTDGCGREIGLVNYGDGTYSFRMPDSAVFVEATFMEDNRMLNFFMDVTARDWYYDDVLYVAVNGLMNGTDSIHFSPSLPLTRGMLVTVLYRMEGSPAVSGACPFQDVKAGSYYEKAVSWAAANGIVKGYTAAKFGPDDTVTREQMAAILYRYAQTKGEGFTGAWVFPLNFKDAQKVSSYANEAMHWCVMNGLLEGNANGLLDPQGGATRAQTAAVLHRFCEALG